MSHPSDSVESPLSYWHYALLPLLVAALVYWWLPEPSTPAAPETGLRPVQVQTAHELESVFTEHGYDWPPQERVPPLAVTTLPPDVGQLGSVRKKALFLRALLPIVLDENARLRSQRQRVKELLAAAPEPDTPAWLELKSLAERFRVEGDLRQAPVRERLLRRVDVVPPALVLAQAANESGWGTSRFAREANNLFGVWTYRPEAGIVPERRHQDAKHYIRVFPDIRSAIRDYLYNINVGHAYSDLRRQRAELRREDRPLDPLLLSAGLIRYSSRGEAYVDEIRHLIRSNALNELGPLELAG